jgi:hypothetical protein
MFQLDNTLLKIVSLGWSISYYRRKIPTNQVVCRVTKRLSDKQIILLEQCFSFSDSSPTLLISGITDVLLQAVLEEERKLENGPQRTLPVQLPSEEETVLLPPSDIRPVGGTDHVG